MKRMALLTLSSLFFYSLFRDMNVANTLLLCAAIIIAFCVSKTPTRYLVAAKYPLICLCFSLSVALVGYPALRAMWATRFMAMFFSFFSLSLYVATISDKGKGLYKETLALVLLLVSASINLIVTRTIELFLPLSITILLFLFVLQRAKLMPLVGAYVGVMLILLHVKNVAIFGSGVLLSTPERYLVLATTFVLLLITFIGFVRKVCSTSAIAFFGLLYASVDILLSAGLSLKGIVLHQPFAGLLILAPLIGVTLQEEGRS